MKSSAIRLFPVYPHKPIASTERLALLLNTSADALQTLADSAHRLYRPVPQEKKDGTTRMTFDAHTPLKRVQHLIVTKILRQVHYPYYLQGAIRDRQQPRDQVSNAAQHAGARILVLDDITDFFPSLKEKLVFDIWHRFCSFAPEVAALLTKLTTYQGAIPQGAKTSSYLANLAFWDIEGFLVEELQGMGFTYTRFVDDVTVSTRVPVPNQAVTSARSMVYGMLAAKGFRPKRKKSHVGRKGQQLLVTGLVANASLPAIDKAERRRIRAAVHNLERAVQVHGWNSYGRSDQLMHTGTRLPHLSEQLQISLIFSFYRSRFARFARFAGPSGPKGVHQAYYAYVASRCCRKSTFFAMTRFTRAQDTKR